MKDPGKDKLSDKDIIDLIRAGRENNRYYDIIYSRYFDKVRGKCYSLVKDRETANDLAEDIMVKIFENLVSFKATAMFSTWIYSITYNHCIDYLRNKRSSHYPKWNKEHEMSEIPDNLEDVENEIDYERLKTVMEELHPEELALIKMKYLDDIPLKLMSEALRITESACKMRLKRARTRLLYLYSKKYLK
ncbi:RNA polymerase sigma factor [Fulvivirga sedimenti]|uniref:Sigma-70 family RNA polymerase sigma factor n=1 Tax=Fulvivirga sedimenti TaxID=2879465 RepID=A0A9X1HS26_9BACT|nr:sigma-70 family RNA polymerase sigma factor [Fulvivirga sedimenti]MCA6074761.1 sigma-70 family RNA polymerase sigma factor [Fulvivirga sedimenti]MCA6075938.1 sigma-70 family RNA polymerase sigma factor [Fulvivirga sedimenti]MCA6077066.1 sigma-70 family RNA polymerase sigma factor [Fulvivirga sedimenti]